MDKGVLETNKSDDVPPSTNMLTTMGVYAVKTNEQGGVIRFKTLDSLRAVTDNA